MVPGVRGRLITASFAQAILPDVAGASTAPDAVRRALVAWSLRVESALGPVSSIRAITDVAVIPLLEILELTVVTRADHHEHCEILTAWRGCPAPPLHVVGWSESMDHAWRRAAVSGIRADSRWALCCNGTALRVIDTHQTWSRRHLEFDLEVLAHESEAMTLMWTLLRGESLCAAHPLLSRAVEMSARHGVAVCRAMGDGVLHALALLLDAVPDKRPDGSSPSLVFEQALTVLYRILFLLFAEARGLVPLWHPIYRDRYSIQAIVTALLSGARYRGIWSAIQAISRLAHAGCTAGELKVTAFNGRLFSPSQTALFDRGHLGDDLMARAVIAVSTVATAQAGRSRIAYRDLDVEQLGAVYEHVLDYEPPADRHHALQRAGDARKSSGTFYTPRAVTAYMVRQTLEPLTRGRSADEILRLRILDPSMGSGAFLVEACRYLAASIEEALIREGRWHPGDVLPADRTAVRREVAQRCLYGVDLNPMAVQLARLSLWLATLAAEKPLTFLDHRLVAGDSLVGATPDDVRRQPSRDASRRSRQHALPLFGTDLLVPALGHAVRARESLALEPDDSVAIVRGKEQVLMRLGARDGSVGRWLSVLDAWCAGWFWEQGTAPGSPAFAELVQHLLHERSALPTHVASTIARHTETIAAHRRFLHWPLVFPEVFADEQGTARADGGFDAIIGNPPWDMVRGDSGDAGTRTQRRRDAHCLTDFVREAGIYQVQSRSHVNRYQLFVERALQLTRRGGRIGLVLPAGVVTDTGTAPLRRRLFDHAAVDSIAGVDNRARIFPIHRSVRFALLTCTRGHPTTGIECRFGIRRVDELDAAASRGRPAAVRLTRHLLERISGEDDLGIPEVATALDLGILEKISALIPALGGASGWNVRFGRELNASDDLQSFRARTGDKGARPVLEGKQIEPFRVSVAACRYEIPASSTLRRQVPRCARLAYRDVASATNRLTLIAAIVPARAVTTHTLFCLKNPLPPDAQHVLCALLNSFVANYLVRLRVNTHVTAALLSRLRVPVVHPGTAAFARLAELSRELMEGKVPADRMPAYAELQAIIARLYGLERDHFEHVLSTFPLVSAATRANALSMFNALQ